MSQLERMALSADFLPGESVVVLYFSDQKPLNGPAALLDWRLDGQLTRMLLDGGIQGRAGEHVVLQNNGKLKADWAFSLAVASGMASVRKLMQPWSGICCALPARLASKMFHWHFVRMRRRVRISSSNKSMMPWL